LPVIIITKKNTKNKKQQQQQQQQKNENRNPLGRSQPRTQSPQVYWSAGGHWERLWGNGIGTAGILWFTVLSFVTVNSQGKSQSKKSLPATTR